MLISPFSSKGVKGASMRPIIFSMSRVVYVVVSNKAMTCDQDVFSNLWSHVISNVFSFCSEG